MRLLVINPNTSEVVTRLIESAARKVADPKTSVDVVTSPFGGSAIESLAEATIAAHAVLTALARHWHSYDAVVIAAFSDPGLAAATEISPIPVLGMGRCGYRAAGADGRRFSVVTMGAQLEPVIREQIYGHGLLVQLISIEFLNCSVADLASNQLAFADEVKGLALQSYEKGAQAVLLGGGPFSGLAAEFAMGSQIPLVDGLQAAVQEAEHFTRDQPLVQAKNCVGNSTYLGIDPQLSTLLRQRRAIEPGTASF